ncbi:TadE/TadG family type IV pilus assembly protein [Leucobacter chromiiresistens]|uniref:TadE-like domain-containing protein n=1 Tax=Leucobacter chromiiresistens TaxID=1079994 RepID=A0A1H0YUM1_9MICO|nr:TadE family type IV pilus minor pilin [Leucobacter chromiiresistens]SDQ18937.1 hypothetical protein SAMN04488565_1212 [Leucobacter chromiiresistens]
MLAALRHDERGTVTAEFAIVVPAVLAVLGLVIGGVLLAAHRIALVSASAEIARFEARGDDALAEERLNALGGRVEVEREDDGSLHCVVLRSQPAGGLLAHVTLTSRSCAARSTDGARS